VPQPIRVASVWLATDGQANPNGARTVVTAAPVSESGCVSETLPNVALDNGIQDQTVVDRPKSPTGS
jgi:hypothetical protein